MMYGIIPADQMPHPACLVDYGDGGVMAAMFHYASEECDPAEIAAYNGYDVSFGEMSEDDPLYPEYANGGNVMDRWRPIPPDGWIFGGVVDSEDGPTAVFLKELADYQDVEEAAE